MAGAFQLAGSQPERPTKYVPIFQNEFFTGLFTQCSPLRDGATPYLYQRFYAATRFERLIAGSNVEITNRLTLARSPGSLQYNSQTFNAIDSFYEFRTISGSTEVIRVIADTAAVVYDATGPSTKTTILTKTAGAGQTYFQGVGNILYMGDGVEQKKWTASSPWTASFTYAVGDSIIDSNGNLQQVRGAILRNQAGAADGLAFVTVDTNVLTIETATTIGSLAQAEALIGRSMIFKAVATATFLEDQIVPITGTASSNFKLVGPFINANYSRTADTGEIFLNFGSDISGTIQPTWPTTFGATTSDRGLLWVCLGSNVVSNWGIFPPTAAPTAVNAPTSSALPVWVASTFYSPSLLLNDTTSIQLLTTAGTTGGSTPSWNVTLGGTTTDGSAVWTNQGPIGRINSHAYAVGKFIAITGSVIIGGKVISTFKNFYKCVIAGTSASSLPVFNNGLGSQTIDGTVTWQSLGPQVFWSGGSGLGVANVGATQLVSLAQAILDSNGNEEDIVLPGASGGSAPTWATTLGTITIDNIAHWSNNGPSGMANTGAWIYAYAFKNSVTGAVSSASPLSIPVTLAANSYISVQGMGSSDSQVDTVEIYRTLQGGSSEFFLADIQNPSSGVWTYSDSTLDSGLNELLLADTTGINTPPPFGLIKLTYHLNRIWGSVNNVLYYSAGPDVNPGVGNGNESFPPINSFVFPSSITRSVPTALGLVVFTTAEPYLILGQGTPNSIFFAQPYMQGKITGLLSYNALSINGSTIYLMASDGQVLALDPSSGVSEVGFPIGDQLFLYNAANAYLAWHLGSSMDTALYVADGSTGWYRLNPTPAPEVGYSWSPKRTVTGGVQAVASVETAPGIHKLLLGPVSSGKILMRDLSTFSDNGSTYTASATIGSLVLAQPGQLAELNFVTTECSSIGSRPTVSVLLDEISGSFTQLVNRVSDPPFFLSSSTLYSDRWYFSQAALSAWCRHMQVKFDWPSEASGNEMLSFSLSGAHYAES